MRLRLLFWIALALALFWLFFPRPALLNGIEGQVVDARTGEPLPNVELVASWELRRGTPGGYVDAGQLEIRRATTGATGRYSIDSRVRLYIPLLRSVSNESPELIVFRNGYVPQDLFNETFQPDRLGEVSYHRFLSYHSSWNGKRIALDPDADPAAAAARVKLDDLRTSILELVASTCRWDRVAPMLLAMESSAHGAWTLESETSAAAQCGQAEAFQQRRDR